MPALELNTSANRATRNYSSSELLIRIAWRSCLPLFRFSPRPMFAFRAALLRLFGARIGRHVHIYSSASIYFPWNLSIDDWSAIGEHARIYTLGPIRIGRHVTISQYAHLCAGSHDYQKPDMPLLKPPIRIHDQAWICADAFVGPDVVIGEGAVVGARAVAMKNVPPWTVVAGNPARFVKKRELSCSRS